ICLIRMLCPAVDSTRCTAGTATLFRLGYCGTKSWPWRRIWPITSYTKYGKVLNANRTYYMTRSQPPFLTQMVLGVYEQTHDRKYLEDALPKIEKYYQVWMTQPHLTPETGLSRYFDMGEGPAPEVVSAERDAQGRTHYELVKDYFKTHQITDYDVTQYYDRQTDQLTPLFYKGDRSMRESGFDPSNRFGPFNIDIIHYNPVCLN